MINQKKLAAIGAGIAGFMAAIVSGITIADRFELFSSDSHSNGKPFKSNLWGAREEPLEIATDDQIAEFVGDYCVEASDPALHTLLENEAPNDGLRVSIRINNGKVSTLLTTKRGFAVTDVLDGSTTYNRPGKGQNFLFFPLQPGIGMQLGAAQSPELYRIILRSRGLDGSEIRIGPQMYAEMC